LHRNQFGTVSKAYKKNLCAYCCVADSSTADHVIARGFFPNDLRANLPKVGACQDCNNKKSQLEHVLTTVMPFGARHGNARKALLAVERRLAKNQRLHRLLASGIRYALRPTKGMLCVSEMTIPFDGRKLELLCEYIIKGLARHHWGLNIDTNVFVRALFLSNQAAAAFDQFFERDAKDRVFSDLGDGVFRYQGIQAIDNINLTLWKMSIYGAEVSGDPLIPGQRVSVIYGVTVAKSSRAAELLESIFGGGEKASA
jgi:hypothetical protein